MADIDQSVDEQFEQIYQETDLDLNKVDQVFEDIHDDIGDYDPEEIEAEFEEIHGNVSGPEKTKEVPEIIQVTMATGTEEMKYERPSSNTETRIEAMLAALEEAKRNKKTASRVHEGLFVPPTNDMGTADSAMQPKKTESLIEDAPDTPSTRGSESVVPCEKTYPQVSDELRAPPTHDVKTADSATQSKKADPTISETSAPLSTEIDDQSSENSAKSDELEFHSARSSLSSKDSEYRSAEGEALNNGIVRRPQSVEEEFKEILISKGLVNPDNNSDNESCDRESPRNPVCDKSMRNIASPANGEKTRKSVSDRYLEAIRGKTATEAEEKPFCDKDTISGGAEKSADLNGGQRPLIVPVCDKGRYLKPKTPIENAGNELTSGNSNDIAVTTTDETPVSGRFLHCQETVQSSSGVVGDEEIPADVDEGLQPIIACDKGRYLKPKTTTEEASGNPEESVIVAEDIVPVCDKGIRYMESCKMSENLPCDNDTVPKGEPADDEEPAIIVCDKGRYLNLQNIEPEESSVQRNENPTDEAKKMKEALTGTVKELIPAGGNFKMPRIICRRGRARHMNNSNESSNVPESSVEGTVPRLEADDQGTHSNVLESSVQEAPPVCDKGRHRPNRDENTPKIVCGRPPFVTQQDEKDAHSIDAPRFVGGKPVPAESSPSSTENQAVCNEEQNIFADVAETPKPSIYPADKNCWLPASMRGKPEKDFVEAKIEYIKQNYEVLVEETTANKKEKRTVVEYVEKSGNKKELYRFVSVELEDEDGFPKGDETDKENPSEEEASQESSKQPLVTLEDENQESTYETSKENPSGEEALQKSSKQPLVTTDGRFFSSAIRQTAGKRNASTEGTPQELPKSEQESVERTAQSAIEEIKEEEFYDPSIHQENQIQESSEASPTQKLSRNLRPRRPNRFSLDEQMKSTNAKPNQSGVVSETKRVTASEANPAPRKPLRPNRLSLDEQMKFIPKNAEPLSLPLIRSPQSAKPLLRQASYEQKTSPTSEGLVLRMKLPSSSLEGGYKSVYENRLCRGRSLDVQSPPSQLK